MLRPFCFNRHECWITEHFLVAVHRMWHPGLRAALSGKNASLDAAVAQRCCYCSDGI